MVDEVSDRPVSAWVVEQAFATWQAARARLLHDDPALEGDEAALEALLGPEAGDILSILERVARSAVHAESMELAAKERKDEIAAREARYKRRKEALRMLVFSLLEALDKKSHEMADMTLSISKGRQAVRITDENAVPSIYVHEEKVRTIDKATLLSVLRTGASVDGAELSDGLASLTIRRK